MKAQRTFVSLWRVFPWVEYMLTGAHRSLFVGGVIGCLIVGVGLKQTQSALWIGLSYTQKRIYSNA
jgi:hypothetical protein